MENDPRAKRKTRPKYNLDALKRYQTLKDAWVAANPNASPAQYHAEMNAILKRVGVQG